VRVRSLVVYRVRVPFRTVFSHARASRAETDNVVVEAVTDAGVRGFGEGVPREYVTGETPASAIDYLRTLDLAFLSAGWGSAGEAVRALRAWEKGAEERGGIFPGAARCALSLALLDAAGKAWKVGAEALCAEAAGAGAAGGAPERVRYSAVCSGGEPRAVALSCLKFRLYGFAAVKLKVGWGEERDVALVRLARRLLGRRTDIRVDANGRWNFDTARRLIPRLGRFGVSSVEEPLAPEERGRLPELRRAAGVPLMLDESVRSSAELRRLAEAGACDLVNIRLSKCGGIFASLALAAQARASGLGFQMGCQVGESGLLSAAGRLFAFLAPDARHLEGSYDRHLLRENLVAEDVTFGRGGWARRLPGAGLGVTIDPQALDRCAAERLQLTL